MYKVGEEVLVKGKIEEGGKEDICDRLYLVKTITGAKWCVPERSIIPVDKTYKKGLADAWELAKKIVNMKMDVAVEVFDCTRLSDVIEKFTPEEALAKIEAYENQIKVGDVVKVLGGNGKGVIVSVGDGAAHILWSDGVSGVYTKSHIEKTGKHIDIEGLLKQIGE